MEPPASPLDRIVAPGTLLILLTALMVLAPVPGRALSESYRKLEKQLDADRSVDTELLETLPDPTGPNEYYLRSRTRDRVGGALEDLDRALEGGESVDGEVLVAWLELSLLDEPSRQRFDRLMESLNRPANEFSGTVWLLGAKYAAYLGEYESARDWARRAFENDATRREALLDLAEYALEGDRLEESRRYLDRYLLEYERGDRSRHWNTLGRLLTRVESDSEAYLAFSHVVRNYPNSLELDEAERRLSELSLPEPFRPGRNDRSRSVSNGETEGANGTEREITQAESEEDGWKIQLGSFRDRERARSFKRRMESRLGESLTISRARVDGTRYYRVQISSFDTKFEARQQKDKLAELGIDAFILDG